MYHTSEKKGENENIEKNMFENTGLLGHFWAWMSAEAAGGGGRAVKSTQQAQIGPWIRRNGMARLRKAN